MQNTLNTQKTLFSNQSVLAHSEVTPAEKSGGLGKHTKSYSTHAQQGFADIAKKQKYKKQRYKTQSIVQKILSDCAGKWRVVGCGKKRISADIPVGVTFNPVHKTANFVNLQQCGSVWLCPVCSEKIARKKQEQIKNLLVVMQKHGIKAHMLTLTAPHHATDDLKDLLSKLGKAKKHLFGDRKSIKFWDEHMPSIGHITSTEVKYSDQNGWHPHFHIIIFTKQSYSQDAVKGIYENGAFQVFGLQQEICKLWQECCKKVGLKVPSLKHGVDLKRGYNDQEQNDAKALIDYALKGSLASELTMSHCKTGRFNTDSLTAFEIATLAENEKGIEDASSKYSQLFYQYAVAFKGKRQSFWSKALKEFLRKNGIEEKTEEEHLNAETQEEEDSKLVYEIEQNEWRLLSSDFESRGEFLVLIEQDIYDFGIDTQKFPRADSFLNRLLGVEGRNLPRS
jgi:plasmid rolling circle replication initiator protein Rep